MTGHTIEARRALSVLLALLLSISLSIVPSCTARDRFSAVTGVFLDRFLARTEEGEITVHALDAYYYDGWYYYRVHHTAPSPLTGEATTRTLVYYGEGTVTSYLNPDWEDFADLLYRYEHYCVAVREGEHRAFSDAERSALLKDYYRSYGR